MDKPFDKFEEPYYPSEEASELFRCLRRISNIEGLFEDETLDKVHAHIRRGKDNHQRYLRSIDSEPRRNASKHLTKKEVREAVFELHGRACLCCGSTEKISIDHVIPVNKGGENCISNYQPLCVPCNSRKSDRIIDYRKEVCNG